MTLPVVTITEHGLPSITTTANSLLVRIPSSLSANFTTPNPTATNATFVDFRDYGNTAAGTKIARFTPTATLSDNGTIAITGLALSNVNTASSGYLELSYNGGTSWIAVDDKLITINSADATTIWLGTNASGWNNAANWSNGIPNSSTTNVVIPYVGSGFYPTLDADYAVEDLTLGNGATLPLVTHTLTASGNVSLGGATMSGATGSLALAGSGKTLSSGGSFIPNLNLNSGASYTQVDALAVATDFALVSGASLAASSYALGIGGNANFSGGYTAGTGTVRLTSAGSINFYPGSNGFSTVAISGGGTTTLQANGLTAATLNLTGAETLAQNSQTVTVTTLNLGDGSAAVITNSAALTVSGTCTIDTGSSGDLTLTNGSNTFGGAIVLTSGGAVGIRDTDATLGASGSVSTSLSLQSAGTITQGAAISAPILRVTAVGGITLTSANTVSSTFCASNTSSGDLSFTNTGAIGLGDGTLASVSTASGGTVTITNSGQVTVAQAVSAGTAGTVKISTGGTGAIVQGASGLITAASVSLGISGTSATNIGSAANPIALSSTAPSALAAWSSGSTGIYVDWVGTGAGSVSASGATATFAGAPIRLRSASGLTIGGPVATSNGAVMLQSDVIGIGSTVSSGALATYVLPNTASTAVSVNGAAGFDLTQAELANITASTIVVGEDATPTVTAGTVTLCANGGVNIANRALTLSGTSIVGSGNPLTTGTGLLKLKSTGGIGVALTPVLSSSAAISFANGTAGGVYLSDAIAGGTTVSGSNAASGGAVSVTETTAGLTVGATNISSTNGIVTLKSNTLTMAGPITSGAAATYLLPNTVGTAVSINGAGPYNLTQPNLVAITASTIVVGEDSNSIPTVTAGAVTVCVGGAVGIANRALTLSGTSIAGSGNRLTTGTGLLTLKATTGGIGTLAQPILSAASAVGFSNSSSVGGDVSISDNTPGGTSFSGSNGSLGGQVVLTQSGATGLSIIGTGISSNNGAISLVADDMNLVAAISAGSGNVGFTSYTATRTINLGSAVAGSLSLVQAELNEVATTGNLSCGSSAHTGQVLVGASLTESSANVGGFYVLSTGAGGTVTQTANLVGSGASISISANNGISLSANITTNAQTIGLDAGSGNITLGSDVAVDSTNASGAPIGATITISSPIAGAHQLLIRSGQASQSIGAQIGTLGTNLTSLTVQSDDIALSADVYATSINLYTQAAGQTIGLGGGAGLYQLDDTEIAHLKAFTTLTVGLSGAQSGLITAQTVTSASPAGAIVLNSDSGGGGVLFADSGAANALDAGSGNVTIRAGGYGIKAGNATSATYAEIKTSGWVSLNVASGANGVGSNPNRVEIGNAAYVQALNAAGASGAFYLGGVGDIVFAGGTTNSQGGAIDVSGTANIVLDYAGTVLSATDAAIDLRAPVLVALDSTLSSGLGNSTLHSTVNSTPATHHSLTVNATGISEFDAIVGGTAGQELSSLTTNAGGTTRLYANVTTTGGQTYNDGVVLHSSPTLASTSNGTIEFAGTVLADATANARGLTVNTGGISWFNAAVGGTAGQELASLTTDSGGTTRLYANVTTTGAQTYNDGVVLYASPTLASTSNGTIEFAGTALGDSSGTRALTVNTGGISQFDAAVGGTAGQELASLTTDSGGTTRLYANVTTTGAQTYNDNVVLYGNPTVASTSNGTIEFAGTVLGDSSGTRALTVNTGGTSWFDGAVGGTAGQELASLTTNAGGTTRLYANVTTTGAQTYNDSVVLYGSPTVASTLSGTIEFAGTVLADAAASARALTVNTGGISWFNAAVGGTAGQELASLTTDAGGTTRLYASVTTTGAQTYNDAVTLFGNAQLTAGGTGTAIGFASTISGAFNLLLDAGASGSISVVGAIGATPLTLLRVIDSSGSVFQSTVDATVVTLSATTGTIKFEAGLTASTLNTANNGYSLSLLGGCDITAATTLTDTGTIILGDSTSDVFLFRGGLTATSAATREFMGSIRTDASPIDVGPSALYGDTVIDATEDLNPSFVGGNAIALGAISVGAGSPTLVVNAGNGAAATFTQSAGATIVATSLRIIANGSIGASMAAPVSVQVSNLEAASYAGTAFLSNVGTVNIGFVGGVFEFLATPGMGGGIVTAARDAGIASTLAITFVKPSTATTGRFDATATDLAIAPTTITADGGIFLYPNASNLPISLDNPSPGFSLSEADLNNLSSTGTVTIGRGDGTAAAIIGIGSPSKAINLTGRAYSLALLGSASPVAFHFAGGGGSLSLPAGATMTIDSGGPVTTDSAAPTVDVAISGASTLDIQSATSVGSLGNPLRIAVATLRATTNGDDYVAATGDLVLGDTTRAVSAANGEIHIVAGGVVTMGAAVTTTDSAFASRPISIAGTSIVVGRNIQAANGGRIDITASAGAITRSGTAVVGAPASTSTLVLSAATSIGVDAAPLNAVDSTWLFTNAGVICATASNGGIFISEADGVQLGDATAGGIVATNGTIDVVAGGTITTGAAFPINAIGASSDLYLNGASLTIGATAGAGRVVDLRGAGGISISAATGIVNGGSGQMAINDALTQSAGEVNVGSGGLVLVSDYTASGSAALNGDAIAGEDPDLHFRGNATFASFTHNGDRLVFDSVAAAPGSPQLFDSNGQHIGNVLINNAVGVRCQTSDVWQTGGVYTLSIQSGFLDLATRGWVADGAATAPSANTYLGVVGSLQLQAGTELRCGLLDARSTYTIDNAGLGATITASGDVSVASAFTNPTNSTLVMTGSPQRLAASSQLGNLTVASGGDALLASNLDLAAGLTIQSGASLDADATNAYSIKFAGDWVNEAGNANFLARTGTVTISRQSGTTNVSGDNTFYNFSAILSGATSLTIRFENLKLQSFVHNLTLKGYDSSHQITLTRIDNTPGNPAVSPPFAPTPIVVSPRSGGDSSFWYLEIQAGATIVFDYLDIYYSNVELSPIVTAANVVATINAPHYCWRWIPGIPVLYSYTEDKDQNGKIDRIRIQTPVNLGGSFSGLRVNVAGYDVAGYDWVTGSPKDFYVLLKEKPYNDTGATPQWNFVQNTSLGQTAPVFVALDPTAIGTPIDTAPPVLAYTAAVPGTPKSFLSFSEPVHSQSGAANPITSADLSFASRGISGIAAISPIGASAREYAIELGSIVDIGYIFSTPPANSVNVANVRDSAVSAAPIGDLSGWGVVDAPSYPNAWAPMPTANGEAPLITAHRVSDVLVNVPIASPSDTGYFIWPIYAKDNVEVSLSDAAIAALTPAQTAAEGIGLIRAFDGSQWLRDRNITLQAMLQPSFAGVTGIALLFDSNVPATLTNPYGLWLPSFAETGFSGIVPYPNAAPRGRGASSSTGMSIGTAGLYNFVIPASDPRIVSVSDLGFFFAFQVSPSGEPLYALRLDLPAGAAAGTVPPDSAAWQWYRNLKPFSFDIHDVSLQKGGATILNNVIDPTKGETVRLSYQLANAGAVTITVFTLDGDVVARLANVSSQAAGDHSVYWNGRNLGGSPVARGLYFVRIVAPGMDEIRKVLVVRK